MGVLSKQWRQRAEELNSALPPLMDNPAVPAALIQAIKAVVVPELLLGMADMLDVLEAGPAADTATQQARAKMERNQRIRLAAAKGDWDVIDQIINEAVDGKPST